MVPKAGVAGTIAPAIRMAEIARAEAAAKTRLPRSVVANIEFYPFKVG
jgi:hypothetical protein